MLAKYEKLCCLFLNYNFGKKMTGIEFSAFQRAKLFIEYLHINPLMISAKYNPQMHLNILELKEINKVHSELKFINLYDVVQGFNEKISNSNVFDPFLTNLKYEKVDGCNDIKLFDHDNKLTMYVVYDKKQNVLTHVNYLHKGKIYRRDQYHSSGFLSSTQYINYDTKQIEHETYFDTKKNIIITKYFRFIKNKNHIKQIYLFNKDSSIKKVFFNENDFIEFALEIVFNQIDQENIFVVSDRSKYYHLPMLHLKRKLQHKKITTLPVIHNTHIVDNNIKKGNIKVYYKDIFEYTNELDYLNVFTHVQKKDIVERFNLNQVRVIPHTYMQNNHSLLHQPVKGKIVYIARLSPIKRHINALEIFAMVVRDIPYATLHLYGHGEEKENIQETIQQLNIQESVFIHEYTNDIESVLCSAEISILTSQTEGFCLGILESIALGCPVISYDIRYSPSDMIRNKYNGYLIPYDNKKMFAQKLISYLSNEDLKIEMAKNAKSFFSENYSPDIVSKKWADLLEETLLHPSP